MPRSRCALSHAYGRGASISYALGSWAPPWGIEYRVDAANAFVLVLVSRHRRHRHAVCAHERRGGDSRGPALSRSTPCTCCALPDCSASPSPVTSSTSSCSSRSLRSRRYVLIALGRTGARSSPRTNTSSLGTIGATFIVIGIGLLYLMTGTLNLADLAARLPDRRATSGPVLAGPRLHYRRHLPQARTLPPASMAAERLRATHLRS